MDLIGEKLSNFQVPVCSLFRQKIFSGQVCYEADLNQFRNEIDWKRALKKGFSFIIDANDEYDVKNLFERKSSKRLENNLVFNSFQETENDNKFAVKLKTISKLVEVETEGLAMKYLTCQIPSRWFCPEVVTTV